MSSEFLMGQPVNLLGGELIPQMLIPNVFLNIGLGSGGGGMVVAHRAAPTSNLSSHVLKQSHLHAAWAK